MKLFKFLRGGRHKAIEKKPSNKELLPTLREQAQQALQKRGIDVETLSLEEAHYLIYDLQVRLIEQELQHAESLQQLATLQKRYTEAYDCAPIGYCTVDQHGRIMDANLTIAEQLGVDRKLLLDTRFDDYLLPEDQEKFSAYLKHAFGTNSQQTCEVRLKRKNGSQFYAELTSRLIHENDHRFPLCRTTIKDVTELTRLQQTLLHRDSELALFNRVTQAFNGVLELEEILVIVLQEVRRLLEVTACSIWLFDLATNELVCRQAIGPHRDTMRGWRVTPEQGIVGWVAKTGKSVVVADAQTDDRYKKGVDIQTGEPMHSILSVPIFLRNQLVGVLQAMDTAPGRFNTTDQILQELLATITSIAMANVELYEQVQHDAHTKKILAHEVNRRVSHTLSTILRLLSAVRRHSGLKQTPISHALLTDLIMRVKGIRAVHTALAEFEWNPLPVSELSTRVVHASLEALSSGKQITVEVSPSSVRISSEQATALGIVVNELVLNAVRHAFNDRDAGRITMHIAKVGETVQVEFQDDGPGYPEDIQKVERHNSGLYLIHKIVHKDLNGKLILDNDGGAVAIIRFKPQFPM